MFRTIFCFLWIITVFGFGESNYLTPLKTTETLCRKTDSNFEPEITLGIWKLSIEEELSSIIRPLRWTSYEAFGHCQIKVNAKPMNGIIVHILKLNLRKNITTGQCIDYIEMTSENSTTTLLEERCTDNGSVIITPPSTKFITLHLYTDPNSTNITNQPFEILFTGYKLGNCGSNHQRCRAGHCIHKNLFCDRIDNCGDNSDEENCFVTSPPIVGFPTISYDFGYPIEPIQNDQGIIIPMAIVILVIIGFLMLLMKRRYNSETSNQPVNPPFSEFQTQQGFNYATTKTVHSPPY